MSVPKELRFTKSHEWVKMEGDVALVGITDFAQEQLSDLTYVELPAVDEDVKAGEEIAVVESVKAASDVYAPISGTIVEVNESLSDSPELINRDPFGEGWIFKIRPKNPEDMNKLLDTDEYDAMLPED